MLGARGIAIGFLVLLVGSVDARAQVDDRIVFVSTRPAAEIHVMNADGTGRTRVTRRAPAGFSAAWSPDGARFAFNGWSGRTFGLWVMDRDGGNARSIGFSMPELNGGPLTDPDWAPGGRRLAVSFGWDIFIVNRDGTGRKRLTRGVSADDYAPAWSPNGAWIAFTGNGGIYRIRTDGSGLRFLGLGDEADWSPNGERIVFSLYRDSGGRDIYSMRADGTDRRRLTRSRADEYAPAWSPGGTRIAYTRGFDGDVFVMNADGSNKHLLVPDAAAPSWSPHGAFISFTRTHTAPFPGGDTREVTTIYTRPADGSAPARRVLTPEFDLDVEASPDGARIAYTSIRPYSTSGVYVADADGGNERFLHAGEGPDWSPDGTRILLRSQGSLYVVNADGSLPTQLPEPPGHDFALLETWRWHPDGNRVGFVQWGGPACLDVYVMNLDGTGVTRMTHADCLPQVFDFDWDPSGSSLVLAGYPCEPGGCSPQLLLASVPDGAPAVLAELPLAFDYQSHPRVSPDGVRVTFVRIAALGVEIIWSMNSDGSAQRQLAVDGTAPAWLPDG
jgi:Tol biopolymer transport system component